MTTTNPWTREAAEAICAGYLAQSWRRIAEADELQQEIHLYTRLSWATDRALRALGWLG